MPVLKKHLTVTTVLIIMLSCVSTGVEKSKIGGPQSEKITKYIITEYQEDGISAEKDKTGFHTSPLYIHTGEPHHHGELFNIFQPRGGRGRQGS